MLTSTVHRFIKRHHFSGKTLLIAYSGGPDSTALLHALLSLKNVKLALAHVDHRWRAESEHEAEQIAEMANRQGLVLHQKVLNPLQLSGNLEDMCRIERRRFFVQLCKEHDYAAILLGHHADDLAETVLKRVLEGASLPKLSSIQPVSVVDEVYFWRPLLTLPKKAILSWLEERGIDAFHDKTNVDPAFLRGRMRQQIIPRLASEFGKEVSTNLARLSEEASELSSYLNTVIEPYMAGVLQNQIGLFFDLSKHLPIDRFVLKHLVRSFCRLQNHSISYEALNLCVDLLLQNAANKEISLGKVALHIDRGSLFLLNRPLA